MYTITDWSPYVSMHNLSPNPVYKSIRCSSFTPLFVSTTVDILDIVLYVGFSGGSLGLLCYLAVLIQHGSTTLHRTCT